MSDGEVRPAECQYPPRRMSSWYPAIEQRKPRNQSHTSSGSKEARGYQKRINDDLSPVLPADWSQGSQLRAHRKVEKGEEDLP